MRLVVLCDRCGKATVIHSGDPVAIPFSRLPELVIAADEHECKERP